jgi:hypothetical protein
MKVRTDLKAGAMIDQVSQGAEQVADLAAKYLGPGDEPVWRLAQNLSDATGDLLNAVIQP